MNLRAKKSESLVVSASDIPCHDASSLRSGVSAGRYHSLTALVQSRVTFICDGLIVPSLEHLNTFKRRDDLIQGESVILTTKIDIMPCASML